MESRDFVLPLESYTENGVSKKTLPHGDIQKLLLSLKLAVNADAATDVASKTLDCPSQLLAKDFIRLNLNGDQVIAVDPVILLHLSNWCRGVNGQLSAGAPTAGNSSTSDWEASLPIVNPFARAPLNYRLPNFGANSFLTHQFGPLTNYAAAGLTTGDGSLVGDCEYSGSVAPARNIDHAASPDGPARKAPPNAFVLNLDTHQFPLIAAATRTSYSIKVDRNLMLLGAVIRAHDESGAGDAERVDGFVRRIAARVNDGRGFNSHSVDSTGWANLKSDTQERFGIPLAEIKAGLAFLYLGDEQNFEKVRPIAPGSTLDFEINTAETVKAGFTAITPGAGDRVDITILGYEKKVFLGPV